MLVVEGPVLRVISFRFPLSLFSISVFSFPLPFGAGFLVHLFKGD